MRGNSRRGVVVGALVACLAWTAAGADDGGRVLRSVVFPGMGQLGGGQTVKGLLYMGGEAALLSMTISQIAKQAAYARNTHYLNAEMNVARDDKDYEELARLHEEWEQSIEDADRAKLMAVAFGGGAALWWVWNVLDAAIFKPKQTDDLSLMRKIRDNTMVAVGTERAQVAYRFSF
jgi:hypothetical protein